MQILGFFLGACVSWVMATIYKKYFLMRATADIYLDVVRLKCTIDFFWKIYYNKYNEKKERGN